MKMVKYTSLEDIAERNYHGYIWYSDKTKPQVLNGELFSFNTGPVNPFVIEALLWDEETQKSVMVRHTGRYHITEFDLNDISPEETLEERKFLPHRLSPNVKKVCFKQLWQPEKDPNCEDWEVLTMKALIFTGFEYSNPDTV